jgi:plasmid stabilization system protein ParE
MIIFWTNESRNRLKDIYDYFSLNVSEKTAKKLINDIIEYSEILASNPGIGPKEILLN